jgi:FMNH2-dependent dimethyl sulfone monooxygenase
MSYFGANAYKFGLFGANVGGGMTLSRAPERWRAEWPEIAELYQLADAAGIEFILPIAKWRGLGGKVDIWGRSYETFTHSAAAGAVTKGIGVFVTAHTPIVTPGFAAKAIATIDHVTQGRVGLNIVCGWNRDEFDLHGVKIDGDRRYDQGLEWYKIYAKIMEGGAPFDWSGEFYQLRGVVTDPLPLQHPRPPVMSAAASGPGRRFAAEAADMLFTSIPDLAQAPQIIGSLKEDGAQFDRSTEVYLQTRFVCRPTRKEAEDYYYYYAEEQADDDALAYFYRQRIATMTKGTARHEQPLERSKMNRFARATGKSYSGSFPGMYPVVGTPDDVIQEMLTIKNAGIAGSTLVFLNYLMELPYFIQEVLPRMERAGLRGPHKNEVSKAPADRVALAN